MFCDKFFFLVLKDKFLPSWIVGGWGLIIKKKQKNQKFISQYPKHKSLSQPYVYLHTQLPQ